MQIVKSNKLRKLLIKGPKYREPKTLDWEKAREAILRGITECCESISTKHNITITELFEWKNTILTKIDNKIASLKLRIRSFPSKQILNDSRVSKCLDELKELYVLVLIDKANNNIAFVCKQFYACYS